MNWNLADCLDTVAEIRQQRPAIIQGDVTVTWRQLYTHASSIAGWLGAQGIGRGAKVALYTYNHIAYLETSYACLQAGMVPVNINYRYKAEELTYLLDNADAEVVLVHKDFIDLLLAQLPKLPKIKAILAIAESDHALPRQVTASYQDVIQVAASSLNAERSGDDLIILYTGGTTGMPKGVMWRQRDLYASLAGGTAAPPPDSFEAFREFIIADNAPLRVLILPPLMHATAFFAALTVLMAGGTVVLSTHPQRFDAAEALTLIDRYALNALSIVGDTFAQPLLAELEKDRHDFSSLEAIYSAGALWSRRVKSELLKFNPRLKLVDGLGSTEAHSIGSSVTTGDTDQSSAPQFAFGNKTFLVDENHLPLSLEPGTKGMIAKGGNRPVGYYKDPAKGHQTFIEVAGQQCTLSGDWAQVNEDGETFTLLGRGSVCINTGGEKVFPDEVEEVLRRYPGVLDAVVVGVPDERWGEAVVSVIAATDQVNEHELIEFVKQHLADYKAPKFVVTVPSVFRGPSGKADYKMTRQLAIDQLGIVGS